MKLRIKKTKKLDETSAMSGGAIQGHAAPFGDPKAIDTHNKKEEREQRLKGDRLDEMYSSSGLSGRNYRVRISGEKEHAGHVERSQHQGLRNVMEDADDTLDLNIPSSMESTPQESPAEEMNRTHPEIFVEAEAHGYELLKVLGAGEYGTVFLVEDTSTGGEYVLKAVGIGNAPQAIPETAIDREIRNYTIVSQAASQDEDLWKHFPETYETWKAEVAGKKVGFIVMEALVPLTGAESAFIPDFNDAVADAFPMDAAMVSDFTPEGRDQGVKAKHFMKNGFLEMASKINIAIENIASPIELGTNQKLDQIAASINPRVLKNLERMQTMDRDRFEDIFYDEDDEMEINTGYDMQNYIQILKGDVETSFDIKEEGNEYLLVILMKLMNGLVKVEDLVLPVKIEERSKQVDSEIEDLKKEIESTKANANSLGIDPQDAADLIDFFKGNIQRLENSKSNLPYLVGQELKKTVKQEIQKIATAFINGIRQVKTSQTGFQPDELNQTPEQREAAGKTAGDIFKTVQRLYKATGLVAKDIHYKNVMKREGSGDIVIVDLGLFRPATPKKKRGIKLPGGRRKVQESRNYRLKILTKPKK